jgi:hypothetical protein
MEKRKEKREDKTENRIIGVKPVAMAPELSRH